MSVLGESFTASCVIVYIYTFPKFPSLYVALWALCCFPVREPAGGLKLYCKGADIVILERLQRDTPYQERTERALEVESLLNHCTVLCCISLASTVHVTVLVETRRLSHSILKFKNNKTSILLPIKLYKFNTQATV